jgi:hypothetical protein
MESSGNEAALIIVHPNHRETFRFWLIRNAERYVESGPITAAGVCYGKELPIRCRQY